MTKLTKACTAVALSALAVAAAPAVAADAGGTTDFVRVDRARVTPSSPVGAQRALDRLGSAAMEACGASFFSLPEYKAAVRNSTCWHNSMTDVVARIDNQYLTAAFGRRGTVEVAENQGGLATHAR